MSDQHDATPMTINYPKLITALAASFAAAGIGSLFTTPTLSGWYAELAKPALNPPSWVFGPVWTVLYVLMAISLYLFWTTKPAQPKGLGLTLFAIQLALNAMWSAVFFGLQQPGAALGVILILWLSILITMIVFWRQKPLAGALLIPYLLWVSFASYLNLGIAVLN
jgi:translocator protein